MANPPSQPEAWGQLETLLDRWQVSLDLHAKYAALDDARYWHVQPWPRHERPQRWIIQLARKRILALKRLVAQRKLEGDRAFVEGIEIMGFLATLVGITSVERFIPLATPETERRDVLAAKSEAEPRRAAPDATRQMPQLPPSRIPRAAEPRAAPARAPAAREVPARESPSREMAATSQTASRRREPARPATVKPRKASSTITQTEHVVIADAVRLLGWGKEWHELAEMIGRLAERPAPSEIRRILRTYKDHIEAVARRRGA